jgi:hypothetical protein
LPARSDTSSPPCFRENEAIRPGCGPHFYPGRVSSRTHHPASPGGSPRRNSIRQTAASGRTYEAASSVSQSSGSYCSPSHLESTVKTTETPTRNPLANPRTAASNWSDHSGSGQGLVGAPRGSTSKRRLLCGRFSRPSCRLAVVPSCRLAVLPSCRLRPIADCSLPL